jgi:hypothetical protein
MVERKAKIVFAPIKQVVGRDLSASPPKADILRQGGDVRFVPQRQTSGTDQAAPEWTVLWDRSEYSHLARAIASFLLLISTLR